MPVWQGKCARCVSRSVSSDHLFFLRRDNSAALFRILVPQNTGFSYLFFYFLYKAGQQNCCFKLLSDSFFPSSSTISYPLPSPFGEQCGCSFHAVQSFEMLFCSVVSRSIDAIPRTVRLERFLLSFCCRTKTEYHSLHSGSQVMRFRHSPHCI